MNDDSTKELDYKQIRKSIKYNTSEYSISSNVDTGKDTTNNNISSIDNIDEQLQESIKKLVKEQTSVAKAEYYDDEVADNLPKENKSDNIIKADKQNKTNNLNTQPNKTNYNKLNTELKEKKHKNSISSKEEKNNNIKTKRNIIILSAFTIVLLISVIIAILVNNNVNSRSYSYNYDKAKQLRQKGKLQEALEYFNKAYNTQEGSNNIELMMAMYECYNEYGAANDAISMLNKILSIDNSNEEALSALLSYYNEKENGKEINQLVEKYKNYNTSDIFDEYQPAKPKASIESGKYYEALELGLSVKGADIYYTIDGSNPTIDSNRYNDTIILDKGNSDIKCISVNDIGVYSDIAEYNYEVEFKQPDVPQIALASGTYPMGQTVEIENIPDNCTVYYTLNGTYPDSTSNVYSEPIALPEGNIILAAITIDSRDLVSSVVKRNYIIQPAKKYSFDEAKQILRDRMEQTGLIKQGLDVTNDGALFNFVYQSKINVNEIDLYYIRMDIKKNSHTTTQGYYGVGIKNGICYTVSNNDEGYVIEEY